SFASSHLQASMERALATTTERSRKQEATVAERYRGSRNVMSGAGWKRKADVRTHDWLIECKTTERKSYRLEDVELEQTRKQALQEGRRPLFMVELPSRTWVVLDEADFKEMTDELY